MPVGKMSHHDRTSASDERHSSVAPRPRPRRMSVPDGRRSSLASERISVSGRRMSESMNIEEIQEDILMRKMEVLISYLFPSLSRKHAHNKRISFYW